MPERCEIVIESLSHEQEPHVPDDLLRLFPTLTLQYRSAFFAIYSCTQEQLDDELDEAQGKALHLHQFVYEDIAGYHCEEITS